ncbi:MAG: ferric reductase-like transmembrane domain-containing protein [Pseudomonadota bacterium]
MSEGYGAVGWNGFKRRYDLSIAGGAITYLVVFVAVTLLTRPADQPMAELQLLIRAFGSLSFLMLTLILCIGPLARFSPRFKPMLYNRRHLGVTTFFIALVHAIAVLIWYHGFGVIDPITSLFVSNPRYDSIAGFPFESLGALALAILFLMAATSHDFWNANLGPALWKALHMGVYLAYAALVGHVALGVIQFEKDPLYVTALGASVVTVTALHLAGAFASAQGKRSPAADGWLDAGPALEIPDTRAVILTPPEGERIAVFRDGLQVMAVSNVCRHQGGPLGEGRILDGCVTCPWHGFQYDPANGRSPPPFNERIATYQTRSADGRIWVNPQGNPPGTPVAPTLLPAAKADQQPPERQP